MPLYFALFVIIACYVTIWFTYRLIMIIRPFVRAWQRIMRHSIICRDLAPQFLNTIIAVMEQAIYCREITFMRWRCDKVLCIKHALTAYRWCRSGLCKVFNSIWVQRWVNHYCLPSVREFTRIQISASLFTRWPTEVSCLLICCLANHSFPAAIHIEYNAEK